MDSIIEFLAYVFVFSVYAFGGALAFDFAMSNLKRNKTIWAGLWFMIFAWYIIVLAYMRFNY